MTLIWNNFCGGVKQSNLTSSDGCAELELGQEHLNYMSVQGVALLCFVSMVECVKD